MEEVAEDYLNKLVSRSLIQAVQTDNFNRVRTCCVHDVVREIIQSKAKDEWFVTVLNNRRMLVDKKIRRISIHDVCEDLHSNMKFHYLRSLMVFGFSMYFNNSFFKGFRLLTLLELEGTELHQFPPEIIKMVHLRYLSLRGTMIRKLPESIRKLKNLEILDLKYCYIPTLPNGILKLSNLYQLRGYSNRFTSSTLFADSYGMTFPKGIGSLKNLQKLSSIDVNGNGDTVTEVGKLKLLQRLSIVNLKQENSVVFCSTLEQLKQLTVLYMVSIIKHH